MSTKKKPARGYKYSLIFMLNDEYKREGRRDRFIIDSNNLEKLLKLLDRHGGRYKRNPWGYAGVYRNTLFNPWVAGENLLFINLKK